MYSILVDTGFWIALLDPREQKHKDSERQVELFERFTVVMPWPVVYETLRTRLARQQGGLPRFESLLKMSNVHYLDDQPYRQRALADTFEFARRRRPLSMVDCLLRLVLDDPKVRVAYLATYNERDFRDLCQRRRVEMICSNSGG